MSQPGKDVPEKQLKQPAFLGDAESAFVSKTFLAVYSGAICTCACDSMGTTGTGACACAKIIVAKEDINSALRAVTAPRHAAHSPSFHWARPEASHGRKG